MTDWVDEIITNWGAEPPIADHCEQGDCTAAVETWCPLCTRFLCLEHDELTPRRCHDCLGGPVDQEAA